MKKTLLILLLFRMSCIVHGQDEETHKGSYIGVGGFIGASWLIDSKETYSPKFAYSTGIYYKNNFTKFMGLIAGFNYASYHTSVVTYQYGINYPPSVAGERYLDAMTIPVFLSFTTGQPRKVNFNPEAGLVLGVVLNQYLVVTSTGELRKSGFNFVLTFQAAFNASIPISESITIALGPTIQTGNAGIPLTAAGFNFKLWYKIP